MITTVLIIVLIIIAIINVWLTLTKKDIGELKEKLIKIDSDLSRIDPLIRDEFGRSRDESQKAFRENREELNSSFKNLVAFLSSLQMGFKTLAIEKRSSEVWELLGAVKTQFAKFGEALEKTKKKLQEATNEIERAGNRSKDIEKKLRMVQELPKNQTVALLGEAIEIEQDNNTDEIKAQLPTAVWRNGGYSASYDSFVVGLSAVLR
jgi:chromosome segregation ATPase